MYLITGAPGVGKTTTAKTLANKLPKSVFISADDVQHFIVNGLIWPDQEPKDEAQKQLILRDKNVIDLSNNFLKMGFTPVLDVVIAYENELDRYIKGLDIKPAFVILDASDEVIEKRDSIRNKHVSLRWKKLRSSIRELKTKGLYIDSSNLSVDEVVEKILKNE